MGNDLFVNVSYVSHVRNIYNISKILDRTSEINT